MSEIENIKLDGVDLALADVKAREMIGNIVVPTKTSQLENDSGFITGVTWNEVTGKPSFSNVATSGSYNDLTDKPSIPISPAYYNAHGTTTITSTTDITLLSISLTKGIYIVQGNVVINGSPDVPCWLQVKASGGDLTQVAYTCNGGYDRANICGLFTLNSSQTMSLIVNLNDMSSNLYDLNIIKLA